MVYELLRSLILPLREIDYYLPKQGSIVDLGCGEGVVTKYLARQKTRLVIGIDKDKRRLKRSDIDNLIFKYGDITKIRLHNISGVVLSDVLHHLAFSDQKKLLVYISNILSKRGVLIIKEVDKKEFIRSRLSRIWDLIFYPKDKIFFNHSTDLIRIVHNLGFTIKLSRPCRLFPGSTTLIICKKYI